MTVGFKKSHSCGTPSLVKTAYPTVISFDSLLACDRRTDGHAAYA